MIRELIKKLPGVRKLVFFFNEVRRLDDEIRKLNDEIDRQTFYRYYIENRLQMLEVASDDTKAGLLSIYKDEPFYEARLAIYTVLIGDYDNLPTPLIVERGCDYYCFTDNPNLVSDFWKIIVVENKDGLDNVRFQRKLKVMPHYILPQYEHSLYIDTSILIKGSVWDWIKRNTTGKPWLVYRHPDRNCIYDEAEACKLLKKDIDEVIDEHMLRYRDEGYPKQNGLTWNAIIYRKHLDPSVIELGKAWFNELLIGSRRDQLSFNYVCWKHAFQYDVCEEDYHLSFLWASSHDGRFL